MKRNHGFLQWTLTVAVFAVAQCGLRAASFSLNVGDIFAANNSADNVLKIDAVTQAQQNLGTFDAPTDVALADGANLYIAEWGGHVKRLNLTNGIVTVINPATTLSQVWGIAVGPSGDLFVTSGADDSVVRINPITGQETLVTQTNLLSKPIGIDFLDADHLVVSSLLNNQVVSVALADGTQNSVVTGLVGIDRPWGIAVRGGQIFLTAYDSKLVQRISAGVLEPVYNTAGFPYGLAVKPNGMIVAATTGLGDEILEITPQGSLFQRYMGGAIGQVTGLEISTISLVVEGTPNVPPVVTPIGDRTLSMGGTVSFTATATDADWPPQSLAFSLDPGAPPEASITSKGLFSFTPTQSPKTNEITVRVTDNGVPPLSGAVTFKVIVTDNTPPTLELVPNQTVYAGHLLTFSVAATDADQPAQALTFSLEPGAPAGATMSPQGVFDWTPALALPAGSYPVTVTVTDSGSPPLSAQRTFTVAVTPKVVLAPGDIVVANNFGDSVIRIDPLTGAQQRMGTFTTPTDLAFSHDGGLMYVCESTGRIQRFNLADGVTTVVNDGVGIVDPWGIVVGPFGALYVIDPWSSSVLKVDATTGRTTVLSSGGFISGPYGIDFLDADHLVISSAYNNRLVSVAIADGSQAMVMEGNGLDLPWGIAVSGADIYVAGNGTQVIQKLSGGTVSDLHLTADFPYAVAVEATGNILASTSGVAEEIVRLTPTGTVSNTFSGGLLSYPTGIAIFGASTASPPRVNTAPALPLFTDQPVDEGQLFSMQLSAIDAETPVQTLTFSLGADAPPGASISPGGLLTWTPTEAQGPATHPITIIVTDDAFPALSDVGVVNVVVLEVNEAPVILASGAKVVDEGNLLTFGLSATDPDLPAQAMIYAKVEGPAGLAVTPGGLVSWTPSEADGPNVYPIKVKVTDTGSPPLSATNTFNVTVNEVNLAPSLGALAPQLADEGVPLTFNVSGAGSDPDLPPQLLTYSLVGTTPPGVNLTPAGVFTWTPADADGPGTNTIAIRVTDGGSPPLSATSTVEIVVNELYLQTSTNVAAAFADALTAAIDRGLHTIRIPRDAAAACFYKLRCNQSVRITGLRFDGDTAVLTYAFEPSGP